MNSNQPPSRAELIALVTRIMMAEGTEDEINEMITQLEENVPHPAVTDLIFYPEGDEDPTPEEVVDTALAYEPTD